MKVHDDKVYLHHILDAIDRIENYLRDRSREEFERETLLQDAVIRQLEIIGEATRHRTEELREQYPEIPWQDMVGMRNKLIHDYLGVDVELVWVTATEDLPDLREQIEIILNTLDRAD
ncbi:MAG: DUF86 domain-containing protein [Calditrichaeota bacterium]|nr:MAG: DUF86 domain-containing protein [Calditrichota bacterium]